MYDTNNSPIITQHLERNAREAMEFFFIYFFLVFNFDAE